MSRLDHQSIALVSLAADAAPAVNSGEYLVLVEEDRRGKNLISRWTP
jgi:hypothetical protein